MIFFFSFEGINYINQDKKKNILHKLHNPITLELKYEILFIVIKINKKI